MPTTTARIVLTRKLDPGIYADTRSAFDGEVATFPVTKRGVFKAARTYRETRRNDIQAFGNIGAGALRLTLAGYDVTEDVRSIEDLQATSGAELIDECIAGLAKLAK